MLPTDKCEGETLQLSSVLSTKSYLSVIYNPPETRRNLKAKKTPRCKIYKKLENHVLAEGNNSGCSK